MNRLIVARLASAILGTAAAAAIALGGAAAHTGYLASHSAPAVVQAHANGFALGGRAIATDGYGIGGLQHANGYAIGGRSSVGDAHGTGALAQADGYGIGGGAAL